MRDREKNSKRYIAPDCPADFFMNLYRKTEELPATVKFSKRAIKFFMDNADLIIVNGRQMKFLWEAVPEGLPELKLSVKKEGNDFVLQWLNEKGTLNYSKGKKDNKGNICIDKEEER